MNRLHGTWIVALLLMTCVGPAALAARPSQPGEAVPEAMHHPPAAAIDVAALDAAATEAFRQGLASLLARQQAPANDTGLVFPPISRRQVIDHEEVQVRYRWKVVKIPVYKYEYEERLVPVKDEYGNVTGYEKRRVRKSRRQVGLKQERRLVRDPQGDVVRTHRRPIYGEGGPDIVPRGFFGTNAMALYVLSRAGLEADPATGQLATALADHVEQKGIPDHTWDLAWLVAAYANYPYGEFDGLLERMTGKLIDGQIRQGQPAGLWGPVSIHYDLLARYFLIEIKLRQELTKLQQQLEALGDDEQKARQRAILQRQIRKLDEVLSEVLQGLEDATVQGRQLLKVTREFRPTEEYGLAGLPYYIYNRLVADIDDTSMAVFALAQVDRHRKLPAVTGRVEPAGHRLSPPEKTAPTIARALKAVAEAQQKHGGWTETNRIDVNRAFDRYRELGLNDVPWRGKLPELASLETLRSNLNGAAALVSLLQLQGDRVRPNDQRALDNAIARFKQLLDIALDLPLTTDREQMVYHGQEDPIDELIKAKGRLPAVEQQIRTPADLPVGYRAGWFELLRAAAVVMDSPAVPEDAQLADQHTRLRYRLVISQAEDGQWHGTSRGIGATSGTVAAELMEQAQNRAEHYALRPDAKKHWRASRQTRWLYMTSSRFNELPEHLYPTLASLVYLVDDVEGPVALEDLAILPPPPAEGAADDEGAAEGEDGDAAADGDEAAPVDPTAVAAAVDRPNVKLRPLLEAVAAKLEVELPPLPESEPAEADSDDPQP